MATNQIQTFGLGGSANVLTPTAYASLTAILANGYQSGVASSQQINTTLRQSAFVANMVAQFIADQSGQNVNDDGNSANLETNFIAAIRGAAKTQVVISDTGAVNAYAAANVPPLLSGTWTNGVVQQVLIAHTNTGASTYSPDGLIAIPIYGLGLLPLQGNELLLNSTATLMKATIPGINSGNPICVLMECAGGAQQVPAATASNQAPQIGQLYGRNKLINGRFQINQRSYVSGTALAVGAYGFDCWKSSTASSTMTFTGAAQGQVVTIVGSFQNIIENAEIDAGYHTLSWVGGAQARVYNSGSGAPSYASSPLVVSLSGTQNVIVEFGAGTVSNVQLEYGGIATTFERRQFQQELALCQRRGFAMNLTGLTGTYGGAGTYISIAIFSAVALRGLPTISLGGTSMSVAKSGVGTATTTTASPSTGSISNNTVAFNITGNWTGLTAGDPIAVTSTPGLAYFSCDL